MLNFLYGILLMIVFLPIVQEITGFIVALLNYWQTIITAKTIRIQAQLDKEQAEMQLSLEERKMQNQEHAPAIGFHVLNEEALEYEEEEE